ncbi:MAG TPA: ATP-binding protein [Pseudomonadaceae bacterium]|nr:ATP-binding protein [Pseudomonadaceae bacterium]
MSAISALSPSNPALLVTTGPESAGKTTLARDLARHLHWPLVSEQSRPYLNELYLRQPAGSYTQADLLAIARQQWQTEQRLLTEGHGQLVCDTDLLVILVWSEVKYGYCEAALLELFERSLQVPRHYLLCAPDIPWEEDPLRESPHDRAALLQRYIDKLCNLGLSWQLLQGDPQQRLHQALEALPHALPVTPQA